MPALTTATNNVFGTSINEDVALEHLGYKQEFRRSFSLLDMIGFSFSIVTCWTALSGIFIIGITAGGPPVIIFSWIGVCVVTFTVAVSMAEMCSRWPVAGGQYSWVALLVPPKISRQLSYITGWFMLMGILSTGSIKNSFAANFILGQANLVFPGFTIQRWQTVLVTYAVAFGSLVINIFTPHLLNRLSRSILCWNTTSFVTITVTLLAINKHKQSASFVFHDFQNYTGFGQAMATIIGIVQSLAGMNCYDTPSHMTEEMMHASRDAPRAILMSVALGAITGLIFLLTFCFCIGNIDETARSSTVVPVIQIFYDSTQSKVGACFMASMMTVILLVGSVSLCAEGSRSLFAFARDNALPFSKFLSRIASQRKIPLDAIIVCMVVQMAFNSIYFGSVTGFNTIVSIGATGFYLSYALPLFARLIGHFSGFRTCAFTGPFAIRLPLSLAMNALGLAFLLFAFVTFNFPSIAPVTPENMNYASAATCVIALLSTITWFTTAHDQFTGPSDVKEFVVEGMNPLSN